MGDLLRIEIRAYSRWQKPTGSSKKWVALSTGFFEDRRIVELMMVCPDAVFCFMWLIMNADNKGLIEISGLSLKRNLMRAIGMQGNRFDHYKRLEVIRNAGLIIFEGDRCDHQSDQTIPKGSSNGVSKDLLKEFQCVSNTPLESPKPLGEYPPKTIDNNNTLNYIDQPPKVITRSPDGDHFEESDQKPLKPNKVEAISKFDEWWDAVPLKVAKARAKIAYNQAIKKATHSELLDGLERYKQNKPDGINWAHPASWLNAERWLDDYKITSKNKGNPWQWLETAERAYDQFSGEVYDLTTGGWKYGPKAYYGNPGITSPDGYDRIAAANLIKQPRETHESSH